MKSAVPTILNIIVALGIAFYGTNARPQALGPSVGSDEARRLPVSEPTLRDTSYVSCWNEKLSQWRSLFARSALLTSPNGGYRAYVEVEATAFEPVDLNTYTGPLCTNTSKLFVAGPHDEKFKTAYIRQPDSKYEMGNSLRLVAWSPDSTKLLLELAQWGYESDAGIDHALVVYDTSFNAVITIDADNLRKRLAFAPDCVLSMVAEGFTSLGEPVVKIGHLRLDETEEGAKQCVRQTGFWSLGDHTKFLKDGFRPARP